MRSLNLRKSYSAFILDISLVPVWKINENFSESSRSDRRRFPAGPRANLRRAERVLGRVRRRADLQLQPLHRLQRRQSHVLREHLPAAPEPGDAELSRHLRQLPHRQNRQVNGDPTQSPDGQKGRRTDETTDVRRANVKRERRRETPIYI